MGRACRRRMVFHWPERNWPMIPIHCCWPMRRRRCLTRIGVPENQQLVPYDSSRWGWLAGQIYTGVSSPLYGTLTFGRQNSPLLDATTAYDPMGGSYAFSVIGNSGKTCGDGDTETCRMTTAIKYRENIGDFRLVVMLQPVGLFTGGTPAIQPTIRITAQSKAASAGTSKILVPAFSRWTCSARSRKMRSIGGRHSRDKSKSLAGRPRSPVASAPRSAAD